MKGFNMVSNKVFFGVLSGFWLVATVSSPEQMANYTNGSNYTDTDVTTLQANRRITTQEYCDVLDANGNGNVDVYGNLIKSSDPIAEWCQSL